MGTGAIPVRIIITAVCILVYITITVRILAPGECLILVLHLAPFGIIPTGRQDAGASQNYSGCSVRNPFSNFFILKYPLTCDFLLI